MEKKNKQPLKSDIERRTNFLEYREDKAGEEGIVEGYAAVFGTSADIGGVFVETIERGAFADAIEHSDIRALLNHDANILLARKRPAGHKRASTLEVWEDEIGLKYRFKIPDSRKDLMESFRRGDIDQSSFAFSLKKDGAEWSTDEEGRDVRVIKRGGIKKLFDVSPVVFPAYEEATAAMRSLDEYKKSKEEIKVENKEYVTDTTEPIGEIEYKESLETKIKKLKLIKAGL